MSYVPSDIPFMSETELRENGIRCQKAQLSEKGTTKDTTSGSVNTAVDSAEYKWIKNSKRSDGCQERIDLVTGMAQTVNLETGEIENYKFVCPKCGKILQREDQSRSWDWRVYAKEKYVHRCCIKGEMYLANITTLDMVVPPGLTIDEFYQCVRFGLKHKDDALANQKI